jgi:hypothetical protein
MYAHGPARPSADPAPLPRQGSESARSSYNRDAGRTMKHIDEVRGFTRSILVGDEPGQNTRESMNLANCVVEVLERDTCGDCPLLSLRFYARPYYGYKLATESAQQGRPLYDADAPIGVEINVGPELAQSLFEQINAQWPRFVQTVRSYVRGNEQDPQA